MDTLLPRPPRDHIARPGNLRPLLKALGIVGIAAALAAPSVLLAAARVAGAASERASRTSTGARMFASTSFALASLNFWPLISITEPIPSSNSSSLIPLVRAFSRLARMAASSISTPKAKADPNFRAAMDRIPDPHPTSITVVDDPGISLLPPRYSSINSRHNWVVGCVPVPKAMPGSIRIGSRPGSGDSIQAGTITRRFPIKIG
mgnify:CR=1 FL=1